MISKKDLMTRYKIYKQNPIQKKISKWKYNGKESIGKKIIS